MPLELGKAAARLDFLIVGTQKSGTTAMDYYLRQNPSVQMGNKRKEIHFFDNDRLDWQYQSYDAYHAHFDWRTKNCVRGEATPIYMYLPQSVERIRSYNPGIKLVCLLRHPAFRAYSHWRMERSRGAETLPFDISIREGRERITTNPGSPRVHDYVERGFYGDQAARLLANFAREQILFLTSDVFRQASLSALNQLADFIGAGPFHDVAAKVISPVEVRTPYDLAARDTAYLTRLFHDDIVHTMALTGLDLHAWLDPAYTESGVRGAP